jgi:predicted NAD-dependent protein-ADP-ribosyltransferase YbiA (DUF1768 family)
MSTSEELYSPDGGQLAYFSKSAEKPPGRGAGEQPRNDGRAWTLPDDFRRRLSNFYRLKRPFNLDGLEWTSVEAYYQAAKFMLAAMEPTKDDIAYGGMFAVGGAFADLDGAAIKTKGGKSARRIRHFDRWGEIADQSVERPWTRDDDGQWQQLTTLPLAHVAMFRALQARFTQDEESCQLLLATDNAFLVHTIRGGSHPMWPLMAVRADIQRCGGCGKKSESRCATCLATFCSFACLHQVSTRCVPLSRLAITAD